MPFKDNSFPLYTQVMPSTVSGPGSLTQPFVLNPPDPRKIVARRLSEQEALQPGQMTHDVVQKLVGQRANQIFGPKLGPKMVDYVAKMAPVLLAEGGDPEAEVAALPKVPSYQSAMQPVLEQGRPTNRLLYGDLTKPTDLLGYGDFAARTKYEPYHPVTHYYSYPSYTKGLGRWPWASDPHQAPTAELYPGRMFDPRGTEPLGTFGPGGRSSRVNPTQELPSWEEEKGGPTSPLRGLAQQPLRFHGSQEPIEQVVHPSKFDEGWNLFGPGLYTTDDMATAEGYASAGAGPKASETAGYVYRIHPVQPVKFFDINNDKIPENVWAQMPKRIKGHLTLKDLRGGNYNTENQLELLNDAGLLEKMIELLKGEGYGGFTHVGGARTGNIPHRVKIYWDPENQVVMRGSGFRYGAERVPPPTVGRRVLRHPTKSDRYTVE